MTRNILLFSMFVAALKSASHYEYANPNTKGGIFAVNDGASDAGNRITTAMLHHTNGLNTRRHFDEVASEERDLMAPHAVHCKGSYLAIDVIANKATNTGDAAASSLVSLHDGLVYNIKSMGWPTAALDLEQRIDLSTGARVDELPTYVRKQAAQRQTPKTPQAGSTPLAKAIAEGTARKCRTVSAEGVEDTWRAKCHYEEVRYKKACAVLKGILIRTETCASARGLTLSDLRWEATPWSNARTRASEKTRSLWQNASEYALKQVWSRDDNEEFLETTRESSQDGLHTYNSEAIAKGFIDLGVDNLSKELLAHLTIVSDMLYSQSIGDENLEITAGEAPSLDDMGAIGVASDALHNLIDTLYQGLLTQDGETVPLISEDERTAAKKAIHQIIGITHFFHRLAFSAPFINSSLDIKSATTASQALSQMVLPPIKRTHKVLKDIQADLETIPPYRAVFTTLDELIALPFSLEKGPEEVVKATLVLGRLTSNEYIARGVSGLKDLTLAQDNHVFDPESWVTACQQLRPLASQDMHHDVEEVLRAVEYHQGIDPNVFVFAKNSDWAYLNELKTAMESPENFAKSQFVSLSFEEIFSKVNLAAKQLLEAEARNVNMGFTGNGPDYTLETFYQLRAERENLASQQAELQELMSQATDSQNRLEEAEQGLRDLQANPNATREDLDGLETQVKSCQAEKDTISQTSVRLQQYIAHLQDIVATLEARLREEQDDTTLGILKTYQDASAALAKQTQKLELATGSFKKALQSYKAEGGPENLTHLTAALLYRSDRAAACLDALTTMETEQYSLNESDDLAQKRIRDAEEAKVAVQEALRQAQAELEDAKNDLFQAQETLRGLFSREEARVVDQDHLTQKMDSIAQQETLENLVRAKEAAVKHTLKELKNAQEVVDIANYHNAYQMYRHNQGVTAARAALALDRPETEDAVEAVQAQLDVYRHTLPRLQEAVQAGVQNNNHGDYKIISRQCDIMKERTTQLETLKLELEAYLAQLPVPPNYEELNGALQEVRAQEEQLRGQIDDIQEDSVQLTENLRTLNARINELEAQIIPLQRAAKVNDDAQLPDNYPERANVQEHIDLQLGIIRETEAELVKEQKARGILKVAQRARITNIKARLDLEKGALGELNKVLAFIDYIGLRDQKADLEQQAAALRRQAQEVAARAEAVGLEINEVADQRRALETELAEMDARRPQPQEQEIMPVDPALPNLQHLDQNRLQAFLKYTRTQLDSLMRQLGEDISEQRRETLTRQEPLYRDNIVQVEQAIAAFPQPLNLPNTAELDANGLREVIRNDNQVLGRLQHDNGAVIPEAAAHQIQEQIQQVRQHLTEAETRLDALLLPPIPPADLTPFAELEEEGALREALRHDADTLRVLQEILPTFNGTEKFPEVQRRIAIVQENITGIQAKIQLIQEEAVPNPLPNNPMDADQNPPLPNYDFNGMNEGQVRAAIVDLQQLEEAAQATPERLRDIQMQIAFAENRLDILNPPMQQVLELAKMNQRELKAYIDRARAGIAAHPQDVPAGLEDHIALAEIFLRMAEIPEAARRPGIYELDLQNAQAAVVGAHEILESLQEAKRLAAATEPNLVQNLAQEIAVTEAYIRQADEFIAAIKLEELEGLQIGDMNEEQVDAALLDVNAQLAEAIDTLKVTEEALRAADPQDAVGMAQYNQQHDLAQTEWQDLEQRLLDLQARKTALTQGDNR